MHKNLCINIVCVTVCTDIMHQNFTFYGPDPAGIKNKGLCCLPDFTHYFLSHEGVDLTEGWQQMKRHSRRETVLE